MKAVHRLRLEGSSQIAAIIALRKAFGGHNQKEFATALATLRDSKLHGQVTQDLQSVGSDAGTLLSELEDTYLSLQLRRFLQSFESIPIQQVWGVQDDDLVK